MGKVVIDMSMSLDGFIAGPNDAPGNGLGDGGMRLHNWMFDDPSVYQRLYGEAIKDTGAASSGNRRSAGQDSGKSTALEAYAHIELGTRRKNAISPHV